MESSVVLVVGGTTKLGTYVIQALKRDKFFVRALLKGEKGAASPDLEKLDAATRSCIDDVVVGDVSDPVSLKGVCEGASVVVSVLGLGTFWEDSNVMKIDFQGNMNVLAASQDASVSHFVFVSFLGYDTMRANVQQAEARERIVDELRASSAAHNLTFTVFRPTLLFEDLSYVFYNVRDYGVSLKIGEGLGKMNPIHEADLADAISECCAAPSQFANKEVPIGGPQIMNFESVLSQAQEVSLAHQRMNVRLPDWVAHISARLSSAVNDKFAAFVQRCSLAGSAGGLVAEKYGHRTLLIYFEDLHRGTELPEGYRRVDVAAGAKYAFECTALMPGTEIRYTFKVVQRDVDFGVVFRNNAGSVSGTPVKERESKEKEKDAKNNENKSSGDVTPASNYEVVRKYARTHPGVEYTSSITCERAGVYLLVWDNGYSRFRKKVVEFKVEVRVPAHLVRETKRRDVKDEGSGDETQAPPDNALDEGDDLLAMLESDDDSDDDSDSDSDDSPSEKKSAKSEESGKGIDAADDLLGSDDD